METDHRKRLANSLVVACMIDGMFLWCLLQTRYIMGKHFDLAMPGEPLPRLTNLVFRLLLPEYRSSLVLIALCYSLAAIAIGLIVLSGGSGKEQGRRLSNYLNASRAILLLFTFFYVMACLLPLIKLIDSLDGPEIDHARERIMLTGLVILTLGLVGAVAYVRRRFLQGKPDIEQDQST